MFEDLSIVSLFSGEFSALPDLSKGVPEFRDILAVCDGSKRVKVQVETVETHYIRWLRDIVIPSMIKAANDHTIGTAVKEMIRELYLEVG